MIRWKAGVKPENYLIYVINEEVTDTVRFKEHTLQRTVGKHGIPTAEPVYDDYGTLIDMNVTAYRSSYDIPFDVKEVQKLVSGSRIPPNELLLAKGSILGHGDFIERPRSVFNLNEFLYGDFEDLYNASRLNYLKSDQTGLQEYLSVRASNLSHAADVPTLSTNTTKKKEAYGSEKERAAPGGSKRNNPTNRFKCA